MMIAVAVVAVLFAWLGVPDAIALTAMALVVFAPVAFISPGRRLAASAWIAALYPWLILLSLYATWMMAWCVLGHRPRVFLDDPKLLGPLVEGPRFLTFLLLTGSLVTLLACVVLTKTRVEQRGSIERGRIREFVPLLIMLSVWLSPFTVMLCDPLRVLDWLMV